jgi:hypothetical protein
LGCDAGVCVNDLRQARPLRLHLFKPSSCKAKNFGLGLGFRKVPLASKSLAEFENRRNCLL